MKTLVFAALTFLSSGALAANFQCVNKFKPAAEIDFVLDATSGQATVRNWIHSIDAGTVFALKLHKQYSPDWKGYESSRAQYTTRFVAIDAKVDDFEQQQFEADVRLGITGDFKGDPDTAGVYRFVCTRQN